MAGEKRGFALKASVEDFAGGSFAYGEGETFDLKAALDEGDGVIVTDHPQVIEVLSNHEMFKHASPEKHKPVSQSGTQAPGAQSGTTSPQSTPPSTGTNGS